MYYSVNYRYVEGIMVPEVGERDVYILGVDEAVEKFIGMVIAVVHRNDAVEDKWFFAIFSANFNFKLTGL